MARSYQNYYNMYAGGASLANSDLCGRKTNPVGEVR